VSRKSHRTDKSPLRLPHISPENRQRQAWPVAWARKRLLFEVTKYLGFEFQ
jgi:hypothetical protein